MCLCVLVLGDLCWTGNVQTHYYGFPGDGWSYFRSGVPKKVNVICMLDGISLDWSKIDFLGGNCITMF